MSDENRDSDRVTRLTRPAERHGLRLYHEASSHTPTLIQREQIVQRVGLAARRSWLSLRFRRAGWPSWRAYS
jgi:hypothetical protein